MGIRFLCPTCGAKLNVKAELAGKRGACPKCQAKILIPAESSDGSAEEVAAPVAVSTATPPPTPPAPPTSAGSESRWFVRPPSGGQYGPALETVLRQWITEGRITPDTLVWREGDPEWQKASLAFPQLGAVFAAPVSAPTPAAVKPAPAAPVELAPVSVAPGPSSTAKSEIDPSTAAAAMLLARRKRARSTALMIMGGLIIAVLILLPILIYVLSSQGAPPEATPSEARNLPAMVDSPVLPA